MSLDSFVDFWKMTRLSVQASGSVRQMVDSNATDTVMEVHMALRKHFVLFAGQTLTPLEAVDVLSLERCLLLH